MSLQPLSSLGRAREPRSSRAARHPLPCCQVPQCHARACRAVEIELPAAWEASATYNVLSVLVGACREHARELARRSAAVLDARADLHNLLTILEQAAVVDAEVRCRLEAAEAEAERLRLEHGIARQDLEHVECECRVAARERGR
jgi:hypothetical protein